MTVVTWLRAQIDDDELDWETIRDGEQARHLTTVLHGRPLAERMLAECKAKRTVLDEYEKSASRTVAHGAPSNAEIRTNALADVIQILAEAYADRPGYREEWRHHD